MARLINRKIRSSTLVENLIALVIISFCLGVVLLVTSNLSKDLNQKEYRSWLYQVRQISLHENDNLKRLEIPNSNLEFISPHQLDSAKTSIFLFKILKYEN